MKRMVTVVFVGLLLLSGCGFSTADLSEIKTSRQVEPTYKSPVDVTDTFTPFDPVIYCTAKLSNAPSGTSVRAEFFYLEGGERKVGELKLADVSGTRYLFFEFTPPPTGWPVGKYNVVVYLDDKRKDETAFSVKEQGKQEASLPAEKKKPVATATAAGYRTYSSPEQGFSIQYPANWIEGKKESPSVALLYLENINNNPITTINVQVIPVTVPKEAKVQDAISLVAQQLIDQISGAGGSVRNDQWVDIGMNQGREIVFQYAYNGKNIKQRQFLTFHKDKVYMVIYTAEEKVYYDFMKEYEKAAGTLSFFES